MTIKELEIRSGLERTTIRFYEREGLLSPVRQNNGYRDYSEEDLKTLLRIKLLRSLHVSLEEIRAVKNSMKSLDETLSMQIKNLDEKTENIAYAKNLCQMIQKEHITFEELNPQKYLDTIFVQPITPSTSSNDHKVEQTHLDDECHPWARLFARCVDFLVYEMITVLFMAFLFKMNIHATSFSSIFTLYMTPLVLFLFLEPLQLMFFGTTIGKFIFGFSVTYVDGKKLTYHKGLERTWKVLVWGLGCNLPILSPICLYYGGKRCFDYEAQPWDLYNVKFVKIKRFILFRLLIPIIIILHFLTIRGIELYQLLPPNRGNLTVEKFVENFNYYATYNEIDFDGIVLKPDATWTRVASPKKQVGSSREREFSLYHYIDTSPIALPFFDFTLENDEITEVSFEILVTNHFDDIYADFSLFWLVAHALIGAEQTPLEISTSSLLKNLSFASFRSDFIQDQDFLITYTTEYAGYSKDYMNDFLSFPKSYLYPDELAEGADNRYFKVTFSIRKK